MALVFFIGGCSASENSSGPAETTSPVSQESTSSSVSESMDAAQDELPEVLHRMNDGTIITVIDVRSVGEYLVARVAAFNDQSMAVAPSAYFDLVDEEGRRSPNSYYSAINIAPQTGAEFNLIFKPEANSTPKSIAFGYEVTSVNNEISVNPQDMKTARAAMEALRANYTAPQWSAADSFDIDGVRFNLNSVKRCSLSEGVALEDDSTWRYFDGQKISCFKFDLTVENESTLTHAIDPLLMLSLYDANGLAGLGTDTYEGPMLWATLKPSQKIRGEFIFATTETGPYALLAKIGGAMGGIAFDGQ